METPETIRTEVRAPLEGVARVLLWAGLGMFLVTQGLPLSEYDSDVFRGYELWVELYEAFRNLGDIDTAASISISGFLLSVACVIVVPFAVKALASSRLWWWFFFVCTAVAAVGFTVVIGKTLLSEYEYESGQTVRFGALAFLAFPYLTLAGLLCLRGRRSAGVGQAVAEKDEDDAEHG